VLCGNCDWDRIRYLQQWQYTIFATLEVNDAVALFVAASTVTRGLSAVVVSSTSGVFLGKQRFFGTVGREFTESETFGNVYPDWTACVREFP